MSLKIISTDASPSQLSSKDKKELQMKEMVHVKQIIIYLIVLVAGLSIVGAYSEEIVPLAIAVVTVLGGAIGYFAGAKKLT